MADYVKLHTDALDNRKIDSLPDDLVKPWLKCLVIARLYGGFLPDLKTVAYRMRVDQVTAASWLSRLQKAELLDAVGNGAHLQPHDWEDWNPPNPVDRTNADRQRRFRERKSASRNAVTPPPDPPKENTTATKGVTPLRNESLRPLRNGVTIYAAAASALRKDYPDAGDDFVDQLARDSIQKLISAGIAPECFTDDLFARAITKCHRNGQTSAGLYLKTVPQCAVTWLSKQPDGPTEGMRLAEREYQDSIRKKQAEEEYEKNRHAGQR